MWERASQGSSRKGSGDSTSSRITAIVNNLLQFTPRRIEIEDLSSKDVIVAVMGATGSGKSSFIEMATGATGLAGHGLRSFTTEISVIRLSFPGLDLCFVDTPGFDDTNTSDVDIFKMISDWLNDTYKREIRLTALLYFHRITDNRMAGTPLKNFRMFEKLCGEQFDGIILTTTMWDDVDEELGEARERELKSEYWKSMIERGSLVKRFLHTRQSAFEILAPILEEVDKRSALLLQTEMNDLHLHLNETSAGRALYVELGELVSQHQDILGRIRGELKDLMDPDHLQLLMDEYQRASAQLQRATDDMRRMKSSKRRINGFIVVDWSRIFRFFRIKKKKKSERNTQVTEVKEKRSEAEDWEVEVRETARVWIVNLWNGEEREAEEREAREREAKRFVATLRMSKKRSLEARDRARAAKGFWEAEERRILQEEWETKREWEAEEWDAKLWETKERVAKLWLDRLWEPENEKVSLTFWL